MIWRMGKKSGIPQKSGGDRVRHSLSGLPDKATTATALIAEIYPHVNRRRSPPQRQETLDLYIAICYTEHQPDKQEGIVAAATVGQGSMGALAV